MTHSPDVLTAKLGEHIECSTLPASFTAEVREELLQELALIYDLADHVMRCASEVEDPSHRKKQIEMVIPVVVQVRCSVDILAAVVIEVARKGRPITRDIQDTCEKAFQAIVVAWDDFRACYTSAFVPPDRIDPQAATITDVMTLYARNEKRWTAMQ